MGTDKQKEVLITNVKIRTTGAEWARKAGYLYARNPAVMTIQETRPRVLSNKYNTYYS